MSSTGGEVALYGYALALVVHGGFLAYLLASDRSVFVEQKSGRRFIAALLCTEGWSAFALASALWALPLLQVGADLFDLARYGLWFAFLLSLLRPPSGGVASDAAKLLRRVSGAMLALAVVLVIGQFSGGEANAATRPQTATALALAICGLLLVEQLFRNIGEDSRWGAKPVCLGLGFAFAFDIYLYAEAMLFGRFDEVAFDVRGAAHTLAIPFLFIASRRSVNWIKRLQVSRTAAFYSATLVLSGTYLLFMSAIGYYVRFFGGSWGRALQLGLLAAALALLGVLLFSSSMRSWLKVFVGKHFFSYRYDYREEWLRFTAMLSTNRSPQEMGGMIVRALAKMVESPGGSLWTRAGNDADFGQLAAWNMPPQTSPEPVDSSLCSFLHTNGWVIDLDEFRSSPRRYGALVVPTWLLGTTKGWLVVPLLAGDELLGFVVLARPLTRLKVNWEVLDLLKTAGRQAAGYLAQMQATDALLEARKFEAFNRMSAFVVHDLKNIVAQLSLMLKNAERLHDNREFQQDMLLTVASSLEKMRRLMLQLREGATPPGGSHGVELSPIVSRLQKSAQAQGRTLRAEVSERLSTRGHDERLERVLGHLVQNALDATPVEGDVWIQVLRFSGQVKVMVGDTGAGMSEEFVRDKLFRPFSTTKTSGMGIGTYEGLQYIRELGGSISVDSAPGRGTVMSVLLPLFEDRHQSALLHPTPK
ncbi:MAG: PEP-CTERM system histidine kinase PrsK [Leptothrix sp. (in: Bacteria)]|nr:PEP-CTERM system histidine kinase PrsK [Leptothrix sp. (in: b-proteobacteria)]